MRRAVLSLFRRPAAAEASTPNLALPTSAIAAIDDASLVVRPGKGDGEARVVVMFAGRVGWVYSDEGAGKTLAHMFPDLNDRQHSQAIQRLRARCRALLRGLDLAAPEERRRWIDEY